MAVLRRTGPSGTATGTIRRSPFDAFAGGPTLEASLLERTVTRDPFELSGPGLPSLPGFDPRIGGTVAPSAQSLIEQGGIALCEQFFSRETCERIAGVVGGIVGGTPGGSEPPSGDPAIPGIVGTECPSGTTRIFGRCVDITPGGDTKGGGLIVSQGEAIVGRFGAGIAPERRQRTRLRCPRGMVLGKDNICYDGLRNSERKWPKGRRPLLTGGDLNAISRASRAATRMKSQNKRLRKLGMLKPSTRTKTVYVCKTCRNPTDQCTC